MKLTLTFSSVEHPTRLQLTEFIDAIGKSHKCTDRLGVMIDKEAKEFKWGKGTKSICLLLVRFAADNSATNLIGTEGPAKSAFSVICDAVKDDDHYLSQIFGGARNVPKFFLHSGSGSTGSAKMARLNNDFVNGVNLIIVADDAGQLKQLTPKQCATLADAIEQGFRSSVRTDDDSENEENEEPRLSARPALFARRNGLEARYLRLDSSLFPLQAGDFVRIQAKLSKFAHIAAVWLGSNGCFFPLHPPGKLDWATFREAGSGQEVNLPHESEKGFPLEAASGVETVILFISETPFEKRVLADICMKCKTQMETPHLTIQILKTASPLSFFLPRSRDKQGERQRARRFRIQPAALPQAHPFEGYQRDIAQRFDGIEIDGLCIYSVPHIGTHDATSR